MLGLDQQGLSVGPAMNSMPHEDVAVVIGSSGGIGAALVTALRKSGQFSHTLGLSRTSSPALDLLDESSIAACAQWTGMMGTPRLIIVATGLLHGNGVAPEKNSRQVDPAVMGTVFAVNVVGPAMVLKHFLPLMPRTGRAVFCVLSARVGSIGDNHLGGWFSYRASKAAVNQLVRTAAIEARRRNRETVCVALHPGTVDTALSAPFHKSGLDLQTPSLSAARLLDVVGGLEPADSGGFFDQHGRSVPW